MLCFYTVSLTEAGLPCSSLLCYGAAKYGAGSEAFFLSGSVRGANMTAGHRHSWWDPRRPPQTVGEL